MKILSTTVEFILVTSSAFTSDSTPSFFLPKLGRTLNIPQRIPMDQNVWSQANPAIEMKKLMIAGMVIMTKWMTTTRRAKEGIGKDTAANFVWKDPMRMKSGPLREVKRLMTDLCGG